MDLILVIALLAGAFVSEQMGLTFVAVLLVALAVLMLLSGSASGSSSGSRGAPPNVNITEPYGPDGPIIVENKVPDVPYPLMLKLKHDWHDYRQFEYSFMNFGSSMHNLGHFLYQMITGHHQKKDEDGGH